MPECSGIDPRSRPPVSRLGRFLLLVVDVVVLLIGMRLVLNSLGFVSILAEVCSVLLTC